MFYSPCDLEAFVNEVNDLVAKGILTSAQGDELIDAVEAVIEALGLRRR